MKKILLIALIGFLFVPSFSFAEFTPPAAPSQASQIDSLDDARGFVGVIANWILSFVVALSVIFVLYGAFLFLTSAGDPAKVAKANKTLLFAAIGVAVGFLAWVVPMVARNLVTSPVPQGGAGSQGVGEGGQGGDVEP